jgi:hypothetical protein
MKDFEQEDSGNDCEQQGSSEPGCRMPSTTEVGWLLLGGGLAGCLITLLRRDRHLDDWALPFGLVGAGGALLLRRRRSQMDDAQKAILAELDELDPIARAQVLKAVAEEQLGPLKG